MDHSKINQTVLDFSSGISLANVNVKTGRLLLEFPALTIGASNFQIATSLIYNSHYKNTDFGNIKIGFGNGWKLNIEQYVFPYDETYNLNGFEEGDYVYIDSNWNIHRFVEYKINNEYGNRRSVFYDTSGSGLRLLASENRYSEIYDGNNSTIKFDLNGRIDRIISSVNADIAKTFTYNNGDLVSVYDSRKPRRKINFTYYSDGKLKQINVDSYNISINLKYNELNQLEKVIKSNGSKEKDILYLKYDSFGTVEYSIDAESLKALHFRNDNSSSEPKIIAIKEGAMKKNVVTEELKAELFANDNKYLGDGYYLFDKGKKVKKYELIMPDNYVKNKTSFTYLENCTNVVNEKNIKTRYYFNINDYTSSILEVDSNNSNNCKTLFKTGGWSLSNQGCSSYRINGQAATTLNNSYVYHANNLSSFLSIFEEYNNGAKKKNEYTENFVVSFWLRASSNIDSEVYANVKINKDGNTRQYGRTLIDRTKSDSWQYITIPVNLGNNQERISDIFVEFDGLLNYPTLYIADFRIAIGNNTTTKFTNGSTVVDLKNAFCIIYRANNKDITTPISSDFFLTDSDLFATYKSLFYMKKKSKATFDLVYCNGTKVKSVSSVKILSELCFIPLSIDNNGIPNYYTYSSNRTGEKQWNATETQVRFHNDNNDIYYETKVAIQVVDESNKRVEESNSSITYEWQNANGTPRAKKDAYSIVTAYNYDSYGNLISTCVYNDDVADKEILTTTYNYGTVSEKLREKPQGCIQNGVEKKFNYNEPQFTTNYTLEGQLKENYSYDEFNEKITTISNSKNNDSFIEYQNTILYDEYGRVRSISDISNRTYGFIYNAFGEPLKYYENGKLILEKKVIKGNDYDTLIDKTYNKTEAIDGKIVNTAYENITTIDKYGKIINQTNKESQSANGETITFNYQNVNESGSLAKVSVIDDPYENVQYHYIYDEENRPSGYRVYNKSTLGKEMQVRQIGSGDTQYYFNKENEYIMSRVVKEDTETPDGEISKFNDPRIRRTKYMKMDGENSDSFDEKYKDYNIQYEYDKLGRLIKKSNEKIQHKRFWEFDNFVNIDKKLQYNYGKTTISKINYVVNSEDRNSNDTATLTFENTYDNKNNITEVKSYGKRFVENPEDEKLCGTANYISRINNYEYDAFDRLKREKRSDNNSQVLDIVYDYYRNSGNLRKVVKNDYVYKKFTYENGRKTNLELMGINYPISYDNYGNIVKDALGTVKYNSRNLLESYYIGSSNNNYSANNYYSNNNYIKKCDYYYNYQGVRYKKKIETSPTKTQYVNYYLDGSRILGEDWSYSDGSQEKSLRYFYDAEGIAGLRYDGCNFTFLKDSLGNVSKLMYQGKTIGEYIYDAWGNCEVVELSIDSDATNGARDRFVLHNNPFRWKSHYYDKETGLYFVNGRYYSPTLMQYLNADNIENINANEVNSLDRHAITLDNSITYEVNPDTIFTDTELYPDPIYEPLRDKSWWSLNWKKAIQWIAFAIVFIVSIVLMCIPATSAFGVGMFMAGLKAAVSGAIIGGLIGGIINAINGNSFMDGLVKGAVEGFINGFTTGALMFCASQAISALSNAASSRCSSPGHCFIAGTLILTALGNKKIEEIEVGDKVWAYDEETGEKSLKQVVELFRNKTKKWIHLLFEFEDGTTEKLVCTEGHPFYVNNIGWVNSGDLLENDMILMYNNNVATLIQKEIEELETYATTYNFEVEDYHTYYVGDNNLLVHNKCGGKVQTNVHGKAHGSEIHQSRINAKTAEMVKSGEYSDIYLNRSLSTSGVLEGNQLRPDIIGRRIDGTFDIYEFASKSQASGSALRVLEDHIKYYKTLSNVNIVTFVPW